MAIHPSIRGRAAELKGRRGAVEVLDGLIEAVRGGESRALVVRGEPGVGKTALLEYLVERASGCRQGGNRAVRPGAVDARAQTRTTG